MKRPKYKIGDTAFTYSDPDHLNNPEEPIIEIEINGMSIEISKNRYRTERKIRYSFMNGFEGDYFISEDKIFSTRDDAMTALAKLMEDKIKKLQDRLIDLIRITYHSTTEYHYYDQ